MRRIRSTIISLRLTSLLPILPIIILICVWFAYEQGVTGSLFYDDVYNLSPLSELDSPDKIKVFVFDGTSGPLGRALALATFLPHAADWPTSNVDARRVNVFIHLANGVLLAALAYLLLRLIDSTDRRQSYLIAMAAASIWLTLPLLASTSLILVQRMASLSAMFGILGLITYVLGYRVLGRRPKLGFLVQFGGLGIGTTLAILTKENGALIPVFALLIETVLARHSAVAAPMRNIRLFILSIPLFFLVWFIFSNLPSDLGANVASRGYSVIDRLKTEIVILWKYIFLAFVPRINAYGPYHDDITVIDSLGLPLLALAGFILAAWLALKTRKKSPLFLFALAWFMIGHMLESTTFMLELYFEHRNYLAIFGSCLAISYYTLTATKKYIRLASFALIIYVLTLWTALILLTSIWGRPVEAAEFWLRNHPTSSRATLALSGLYYQELNGNSVPSRHILDRTSELCPLCLDVRMQGLLYACDTEDPSSISARMKTLIATANTANLSSAVLDGIYPLREFVENGTCKPIKHQDIQDLLFSLLLHPGAQSGGYGIHLNYLAALNAHDRQDIQGAVDFLNASEIGGATIRAILLRLEIYLEEGQYKKAMVFLEGHKNSSHLPRMTRGYWNQQLDEMIARVRARENEKLKEDH